MANSLWLNVKADGHAASRAVGLHPDVPGNVLYFLKVK